MVDKCKNATLVRMITEKIMDSADAMRALAAQIGKTLTPGTLVLLKGDLGTGKTTFVQGLAASFGITGVASPSFTVVSEYVVPRPSTIRYLMHADLYRLTPTQAQADPLIAEIIASSTRPDRLTVIEWADRLGKKIPATALSISFSHGSTVGERIVRYTHG